MTTVRSIVEDALIEAGVFSPFETPTQKEIDFGIRTLNRLIDLYNTQKLTISYSKLIQLIPTCPKDNDFVAGYVTHKRERAQHLGDPVTYKDFSGMSGCYMLECEGEGVFCDDLGYIFFVASEKIEWEYPVTIGRDKLIEIPPPISIDQLFWRQNGTDYISKEMTVKDYSKIAFKSSSTIPERHYVQIHNDKSMSIYFDQVPLPNLELWVFAEFPLTIGVDWAEDITIDDSIEIGYGMDKMLTLRLAYELCGSYQVNPQPSLAARLLDAENNVKAFNYKPMTLNLSTALTSRRRVQRNRARY